MATTVQQADLIKVIITPEHVAVVDPALPHLGPVLGYRRKTFVAGGPQGHREVVENVTLCEPDVKGRLCFAAGVLPRVLRILGEQGYEVRVDDRRKPGPRLRVDEDALADCRGRDWHLLRVLAHHPLGQIEVGFHQDVLEKMLLVARLFPDARVVVAVPTRAQARILRRGLADRLDEGAALAVSGVRPSRARWLVATFGSVPIKRAGEYDILLLPFAEQSSGTRACEMIARMHFRRRYAFVRPQRRADALVQLCLEQIFAEVIHGVKKPRVPTRVLMLPTPCLAVAYSPTPLERKRAFCWHNQERNEFIADVARAVYSLDRAVLKQLGLRNRDVNAIKKCDKARLRLLVDTPEHARVLLALLPGWRVGSLNEPHPPGANDTPGAPVIMAGVYASTMDVQADIVIRGSGTEWPMRVRGFPPRLSKNTPPTALVLDFVDAFHQAAREDTERRITEYRHQGMEVHVLTPKVP